MSMVGSIKGSLTLCERVVFLHREVLASKITRYELKEVLNQVNETVNVIKTRAMKSIIF